VHVELCLSLFSVSIGQNVINHTIHISSSSPYSLLKTDRTQLKTMQEMTSKINKICTVTNNWVFSKCLYTLYSARVTQFFQVRVDGVQAVVCCVCVFWGDGIDGPGRAFYSPGRAGPGRYFNGLNGPGRIGPKFYRAGPAIFGPCRALVLTQKVALHSTPPFSKRRTAVVSPLLTALFSFADKLAFTEPLHGWLRCMAK